MTKNLLEQKRRKMFGVRGLIIIHEHREGNWLINIHEIALRVAVVNMLPFLEPLRWTNTANCWSVSTVVHAQEDVTSR